ncbi:hypothetical protein CPB83DRAFT_793363 [Crepidotus variabilis]|uniref:BTB domain-containing protein n=1 Tax=Crepidotus variabilis TaxID=179855 RepID=A0A9P6EDX0_9AGAR|nr:hypothetical protein CPB83DRAFT_793363 [Crepidotus variabilis]
MANPISRKRPRMDETQTINDVKAVRRSITFWFSDGSVVLQGEDTQFRVHKSMLALHSVVFRDTFQVSQPASGEESVEGCPVVHLTETAEDVEYMLSALYERKKRPQPAPFSFLSAMLRLGRKYDIQHILDEAVEILDLAFPSSLAEYQRVVETKNGDVIEYSLDMMIDLANLALDMSRHSILPTIYFIICRDFDAVLKGAQRANGTTAKLDENTKDVIIWGREELLKKLPTSIFSWVKRTSSPGCFGPRKNCVATLHEIMEKMWTGQSRQLACFAPIDDFIPSGCRACSQCLQEMRAIHTDQQKELWIELPKYFGWESWEEARS